MKKEYLKKTIQELVNIYITHGKIEIALDVDDTIIPWKYNTPNDSIRYERTINLIKRAQKVVDAEVCLWTCSEESRYKEIKQFCHMKGLKIAHINDSSLKHFVSRKIFANIYIDDKAGLFESLYILEKTLDRIKYLQTTSTLERIKLKILTLFNRKNFED